jgi:curved DNA-binding protein CbpA
MAPTVRLVENLYDTFKTETDASLEVISKQRRRLLLLLHPDKNKCKSLSAATKDDMRALIDNAYDILRDDPTRRRYDELLKTRRYAPHGALDNTDFAELRREIMSMPLRVCASGAPPSPPPKTRPRKPRAHSTAGRGGFAAGLRQQWHAYPSMI